MTLVEEGSLLGRGWPIHRFEKLSGRITPNHHRLIHHNEPVSRAFDSHPPTIPHSV